MLHANSGESGNMGIIEVAQRADEGKRSGPREHRRREGRGLDGWEGGTSATGIPDKASACWGQRGQTCTESGFFRGIRSFVSSSLCG